jgi:polysaccharide export outer membrane protein
MIVGFMRRNREVADRVGSLTAPSGKASDRLVRKIAAKAIDSTLLAQVSGWEQYRVFETKKVQSRPYEAKWEKPVNGLKRGSYPMKWSLVMVMGMLSAMPVAAIAQPTQTAATAQSAAPATPNPSTTDSSDIAHYIIGAEDSLQITVWKQPTLSGTIPVRPDGRISMVLLGDLQAAGMTPMHLAADISERLKKYVQDPIVSVVVLGVNSQRIFMIGEVGHVGAITMTPGMTPLQAIASAGGLSPFAHSKRIYILRGMGAAQKKIPFDYKKALKGDDKQDVSLEPGDTIVVP